MKRGKTQKQSVLFLSASLVKGCVGEEAESTVHRQRGAGAGLGEAPGSLSPCARGAHWWPSVLVRFTAVCHLRSLPQPRSLCSEMDET